MTLELLYIKSMQWTNDQACFAMFDPLAHVLTYDKTPASFAYITPITIGTGYFVNNVQLVFDRWSEFGGTKFLLQSLEGLTSCK